MSINHFLINKSGVLLMIKASTNIRFKEMYCSRNHFKKLEKMSEVNVHHCPLVFTRARYTLSTQWRR